MWFSLCFIKSEKQMFQSHQRGNNLWKKEMCGVSLHFFRRLMWNLVVVTEMLIPKPWSGSLFPLCAPDWVWHWNPVCSGSGLSFQRSQVELMRMVCMGLEKERREQSWSCQWYFYKPASGGHFHVCCHIYQCTLIGILSGTSTLFFHQSELLIFFIIIHVFIYLVFLTTKE